jgi:polyisoprenoid-binding protein YceI
MIARPRRRRRWIRWTIGVCVALVVLLAGGLSFATHVATAPALLALPRDTSTASGGASAQAAMDGVWNAGPGSIVGWRAQQVLLGQQSTLTGRTGKVWGSLTISAGSVTQGSFAVDMTALTSSLSTTTQSSVFDVKADPTGTLVLTSPAAVSTVPAGGNVERFPATATLTLHGVGHSVQFTASIERVGTSIHVLADIALPFADWNISIQGVPWLADIQSPATIEVLLDLTQGTGNPAYVASPAAASGNAAP